MPTVMIEDAKIGDMALRLSAMPIEAQITTSPKAKSLRVNTMKLLINRATAITMAVQSACVGSGIPGNRTFNTDAMLAMMASEIHPR